MEYGVKKKPVSKSNYIGFYLPQFQLVKISFFPSINEFRFESHLPQKKKKPQLCFGLIKKIINK